jgi:hypothetical protein
VYNINFNPNTHQKARNPSRSLNKIMFGLYILGGVY